MQSVNIKLYDLLENLEKEDYDKAVSYIEFLIHVRKEKQIQEEGASKEKEDIETLVASLTGAIPDTGKTLKEYRDERLRKYENID